MLPVKGMLSFGVLLVTYICSRAIQDTCSLEKETEPILTELSIVSNAL